MERDLQAWCAGLSQKCHFTAMEYNVPLFRLSTLYSFFTYALLAEHRTCISRALGFPFFFYCFVRIVTHLIVRT